MAVAPTTSKIMIIRHAEKPPSIGEPFGVTAAGDQDVESLMIEGWQRAGALACFFAPTRGPLQSADLATPQFLFASESKSGGGSSRPVETITPLASKLGLTPKTHKKSDIDKVAADAMACGGIALISWQHEDIPSIANIIVGNRPRSPRQWPGARFDVVWVFDLDHRQTLTPSNRSRSACLPATPPSRLEHHREYRGGDCRGIVFAGDPWSPRDRHSCGARRSGPRSTCHGGSALVCQLRSNSRSPHLARPDRRLRAPNLARDRGARYCPAARLSGRCAAGPRQPRADDRTGRAAQRGTTPEALHADDVSSRPA